MSAAGEGAEAIACSVLVSGRVQGVGFRWRTCERARSLGVSGSVRNLRDGSVEVFAEGAPSQVDALVEWLRRGPAFAHVDRLVRTPATPQGASTFEILA